MSCGRSDEEARAAARSDLGRDAFGLRHAAQRHVHGVAERACRPRRSARRSTADIGRIAAIWRETRARFGEGGPFLFGAFTNADAMYAPVATRFRTYGVDLSSFGDDGTGAGYIEAILALPAMAEWTEGAAEESEGSA